MQAKNGRRKTPKVQQPLEAPQKGNEEVASAQIPQPFRKLGPMKTADIPGRLDQLNPTPIQLPFLRHPLTDRPDEFFLSRFQSLFHRLQSFSLIHFGITDIDKGDFYQPWAANLGTEFTAYVEQIAVADPATGGWDGLLRNSRQRALLVMAVIMRVLEIRVFGAELWGANEEQSMMLREAERAFLESEGTLDLSPLPRYHFTPRPALRPHTQASPARSSALKPAAQSSIALKSPLCFTKTSTS